MQRKSSVVRARFRGEKQRRGSANGMRNGSARTMIPGRLDRLRRRLAGCRGRHGAVGGCVTEPAVLIRTYGHRRSTVEVAEVLDIEGAIGPAFHRRPDLRMPLAFYRYGVGFF